MGGNQAANTTGEAPEELADAAEEEAARVDQGARVVGDIGIAEASA